MRNLQNTPIFLIIFILIYSKTCIPMEIAKKIFFFCSKKRNISNRNIKIKELEEKLKNKSKWSEITADYIKEVCKTSELFTCELFTGELFTGELFTNKNKNYINCIINCIDDGVTPLIVATYLEDIEVVNLLLKYGFDVNQQGSFGDTAILWACMQKNAIILASLIQFKAKQDIPDSLGNTPIEIVCQNGNLEIFNMLFEKNNNYSEQSLEIDAQKAKHLLNLALANDEFEIAKKIVEKFPDLEKFNKTIPKKAYRPAPEKSKTIF